MSLQVEFVGRWDRILTCQGCCWQGTCRMGRRPHWTLAPRACRRQIRVKMQECDIVDQGGTQLEIYLLTQTLSKCGRRCLFQRPTAAQWSQSWQRQAPKDGVFSIKIICHPSWSEKKSNPWSYQVHVWILRARACGTPFYGVDLLLMSLERVNGCNLIV